MTSVSIGVFQIVRDYIVEIVRSPKERMRFWSWLLKMNWKLNRKKMSDSFHHTNVWQQLLLAMKKSLSFGNFSLNFRPNYRKFDSWLPFRTSRKNKSGENREFRAKINLNSDAFVASKVSSEARNGFFVYHYQNKLIFLSWNVFPRS